jgi:protein TonB
MFDVAARPSSAPWAPAPRRQQRWAAASAVALHLPLLHDGLRLAPPPQRAAQEPALTVQLLPAHAAAPPALPALAVPPPAMPRLPAWPVATLTVAAPLPRHAPPAPLTHAGPPAAADGAAPAARNVADPPAATAPQSPVVAAPAPVPPVHAQEPKTVPSHAVAYLQPPAPVYPPLSRRAGEAGRVIVKALVDAGGAVRQLVLEQSCGHARLDESALAAVRTARFRPYTEDGVAQPVWVRVPIVFELQG